MGVIAKKLGRSEESIKCRAQQLGLGAASRGTMSLQQFAKKSGFSTFKIVTAAKQLGLKLRRALRSEPWQKKRIHRFAISDEQQEELLAYMLQKNRVYKKTGKKTDAGLWGVGIKPACCVRCFRNDRPHYARGFCAPCYQYQLKARKDAVSPGIRMVQKESVPSPPMGENNGRKEEDDDVVRKQRRDRRPVQGCDAEACE